MISIVIPVLNEIDTIGNLLRYLSETASSQNISEILVVDGGSTDGTQETITQFSATSSIPILLIHSEKGRAKQMNFGAEKAQGRILYFLHADSLPPKGFDDSILSEVKKGHQAGCFRMKFDSNHPVLRFSQWFTKFNLKMCRGGDQSLFVTQKVFEELGAFDPSYTIYEDCELIGRIYDNYKFVVINDYLTTSARKYRQNGTMKLQYHFTVIHLKKFLGASPENLNLYYRKNIVS